MPWKPLPSLAFAICIYPFRASHAQDLPLEVGDHIYIIEQGGINGDWYRGYLVAPPSLLAGLTAHRGQQLEHRVFSGIFPRNCVEVRELLGDDKDHSGPASENTTALHTPNPSTRAPTAEGERESAEELKEKRKSQKAQARRLSQALSRKKSQRSVRDKSRSRVLDFDTDHPVPPLPNASKPIAPVPLLRVGDETSLSAEEPLVDEIASCLREWHDARLHDLLLARGYTRLGKVQELIKRIDTSRKQLIHDVMTIKELSTLREDIVWDLVAGNKLLNDEVVVRSPHEKGRILTAEDSVIEMTKLQANMSILDRPPKPPLELNMLYHILVDVRNLVIDSEQPATVHVYVCSKEYGDRPHPLTETFSITAPSPDAQGKLPPDSHKSLFVNLSATDVGFGADTTSLYLIFKLLRDEPVRQAVSSGASEDRSVKGHAHTDSTTSTILPRNSLRSRRSVFGSQRRKADGSHRSPSNSRPATAQSALSENISDAPSSEAKTVKRTFGVAVIDIASLVRQQRELHQKVTVWAPAKATDAPPNDNDGWNDVIRELMRSPTNSYLRVPAVKRFELFTTAFATHDLDALIRSTPTLLQDIHTTPNLGFSAAPSERRSDIYLTLTEPIIPGRTNAAVLAHAKHGTVPLSTRTNSSLANLQLTLEVRKASGERLEDCIFTSSNHGGHTAWRTTAVERGEGWNQTIRLAIPTKDVLGCHVIMSIADSPHFPFALAWLPLWEYEAFVRDGDHHVALYVYDEYSSSIIGGKGAYLALPPWHAKNPEPGQAPMAHLSIRTFLCSTEYSQDPNLLAVLNWRKHHGGKLVQSLERFSLVPHIEIVKLLSQVFDTLFQIMEEYPQSEVYEDLVFANFVTVFDIARDKRFDLGNVIKRYATTRHKYSNASKCLLRAYQRLVTTPLDPVNSRRLRATLKVGDQMLKLIIETHKIPEESDYANGHADERHPAFFEDIQKLFVAIMALMRNPLPVLLGTQTLVVQYFHSWLPELATIMSPSEILEIATNLLDAGAHAEGRLVLHRLVLIINYSHLDIFKQPEVRKPLVANTYRWLAPYWGTTTNVTEQWHQQVRLCCSVVAAQMVELGEESCQYVPKLVESYACLQNLERPSKRTFSMLFPASFPFPQRKTPIDTAVDEALLEISALLAAALATKQPLYFDASIVDIPGVLMQALKVVQSILTCEAFPRTWLSLHVSHHNFATISLRRIQEVLVASLPDVYAPNAEEAFEFDTPMWRAFFECLFTAMSSPALTMETFPEQKRRAIWKIAGDVREVGANLLKHSWDSIGWETDEESRKLHGFERMGGYQVQFVPDLVPSIVQLCLSMHASLRNVATEVLRSMIIGSWEIDQDLGMIQSAMIDCLDKLCGTKSVNEVVLQKTFIDEMMQQFKHLQHGPEDDLYRAVEEMFKRVEELLGLLGIVHASDTMSESARIVDTLRLLEFLRDVQSDAAFIRYVHQLADLQAKSGNHTEAGLAIRLHADRYDWDQSTQVEEMLMPKMPSQKSFERKEALYLEMIQHFERGLAWPQALQVYRELGSQYEHNVFDYHKLSRTQRAMASIHERVSKGERLHPRYFRVIYRGLGFPLALRDKEFIVQGAPDDRLAKFEDKMQQLHPSAQIVHSGVETDVEGQYLQVFAVSTHKDLNHTVYQRIKVSPNVREHCLLSDPQKFSTTSRKAVHDIPVTDQPVEKVIYTTAEPFPTILKRAEIVSKETVTLTPTEAAVERTTRKTQELFLLERRINAGEETAMGQLSELLLLSVDPDSDSSVSRYRSLLPASIRKDTDSAEIDPNSVDSDAEDSLLDPMHNALKVALLDHALVIRRCLSLYGRSAWIATRAELVPRFEATFAPELKALYPGQALDFSTPTSPEIESHAQSFKVTSPQAKEGADHGANDDTQQDEPDKRRGRRRSLSFLKRGASVTSLRKPNGTTAEDSQNAPRESSRTRSTSRTGRISLFRAMSNDKRHGVVERSDSTATTDTSGGAGNSLRKRLSFIGQSQNSKSTVQAY